MNVFFTGKAKVFQHIRCGHFNVVNRCFFCSLRIMGSNRVNNPLVFYHDLLGPALCRKGHLSVALYRMVQAAQGLAQSAAAADLINSLMKLGIQISQLVQIPLPYKIPAAPEYHAGTWRLLQ